MNEAKRIGLVKIVIYDAVQHRLGVRQMLEKNGWEERYIAGQLAVLDDLATGETWNKRDGARCLTERPFGELCTEESGFGIRLC